MKIAIIGAGFAGLATAWHLFQKRQDLEITLYDGAGIGGEASGIAAGLLHPFVGMRAKLNLHGKEAFESSCRLLIEAEKALNNPTFTSSGLLRLALNESQEKDYLECSKANSDVTFFDRQVSHHEALSSYPGILIPEAKTVYVQDYLKGLFLCCQKMGLKFENRKIEDLTELSDHDKIIVTAGAGTHQFKELHSTVIYLVKGQTLELEWPETIPPLKVPLSSQNYILMNQDMKSCIVGATYERNFDSHLKDQKFAAASILPKIILMIPALKNAKIMNCKSAVRVSTKDHLPIIRQINHRLFAFVGLGSKGLLYHSFYAEKLATLCIKDV